MENSLKGCVDLYVLYHLFAVYAPHSLSPGPIGAKIKGPMREGPTILPRLVGSIFWKAIFRSSNLFPTPAGLIEAHQQLPKGRFLSLSLSLGIHHFMDPRGLGRAMGRLAKSSCPHGR